MAQNPKNIRFEDLKRLLEDYGFELKRTKGSHHSFVGIIGDEKVTVVIPFRKPLQEIYVKNTLAILEKLESLSVDETLAESDTEHDEQDT
ncbi:MAG: type II toxin-antitoxin system HicA family toxin [Chloroflexi bacterium]|nr:type II toxin-antitoxin system HicA family toxin [Chloroflexota bacterium]